MALGISYRLQAYIEPLAFLAIAFYALLLILLEILTLRLSPTILLSKQTLSSEIFSKTWLRICTLIFQNELTTPLPRLLSLAHGTILELGPGSGNQIPRYDKSRITRIYGVEPNANLHAALLKTVKEEGLSDVYTVVGCGVEDAEELGRYGIGVGGEGEGVDCVVCVQVLCSVPAEKLEGVARGLYGCLKKGGELILYEHVRSDDAMSGFVQRVYNLVWPFFMGNCHLDRPIGEVLLKAGKWERVELEPRKEEDDWGVFPHVAGRLVK